MLVFSLPATMFSHELLLRHKQNYYLSWLSSNLLAQLWLFIKTISNLLLFCLLPFSYFLMESSGRDTDLRKSLSYHSGDKVSGFLPKDENGRGSPTTIHNNITWGNLKSRILETSIIFSLFTGILAIITGLLSTIFYLNSWSTSNNSIENSKNNNNQYNYSKISSLINLPQNFYLLYQLCSVLILLVWVRKKGK